MDPKRIVEAGYDRIAERHAAWALETRTKERARYTALLAEMLPPGAHVVELGCGVGGPTTRALAARFRLTGVDISARSVELAREAIPGATFVHADMTRLELLPESVDGVAAFYSISHVPRDEHAALFARIAGWLRPGGVLVAALGARDNPADLVDDWLGAPMFWSGHDAATAEALVAAAGFNVAQARIETADEDGQPIRFLWIVARRAARIYADFNGYGYYGPLDRRGVPLDTYGSLSDLASAGVILREGLRLTLYSDSSETEDLEADAVVFWDAEREFWVAECAYDEIRDVPTRNHSLTSLVCVRCRTPWNGALAPAAATGGLAFRPVHRGDVCATCGERMHRPIDPPSPSE